MALIYDSSHSGQEIDAAVDAVQTTIPSQLAQIGSKIGDLTNLETEDKTSTVSAINEVNEKVSNIASGKYYGYYASASELPASGTQDGFAYVGATAPYSIYNGVSNGSAMSWTDSGSKMSNASVADEEDITQDSNGKLSLKDRGTTDGMGYIILRKNKSFSSQVTKQNTIYEIRYDFDLDGASVTIPVGCTLKFNGGKLSNGYIYFQNTYIDASNIKIFDGIVFGTSATSTRGGRLVNTILNAEWFGVTNDGTTDCADAINTALNNGKYVELPIELGGGSYVIGSTITMDGYKKLIGNGETTLSYTGADVAINMSGDNNVLKDLIITESGQGKQYVGIQVGEYAGNTYLHHSIMTNVYTKFFSIGIALDYQWGNIIENLKSRYCGTGIQVGGTTPYLVGCECERDDIGILAYGTQGVTCYNCLIEANTIGVKIEPISSQYAGKCDNTFISCYFEGNSGGHIVAGQTYEVASVSLKSCRLVGSKTDRGGVFINKCNALYLEGEYSNGDHFVLSENCKVFLSNGCQFSPPNILRKGNEPYLQITDFSKTYMSSATAGTFYEESSLPFTAITPYIYKNKMRLYRTSASQGRYLQTNFTNMDMLDPINGVTFSFEFSFASSISKVDVVARVLDSSSSNLLIQNKSYNTVEGESKKRISFSFTASEVADVIEQAARIVLRVGVNTDSTWVSEDDDKNLNYFQIDGIYIYKGIPTYDGVNEYGNSYAASHAIVEATKQLKVPTEIGDYYGTSYGLIFHSGRNQFVPVTKGRYVTTNGTVSNLNKWMVSGYAGLPSGLNAYSIGEEYFVNSSKQHVYSNGVSDQFVDVNGLPYLKGGTTANRPTVGLRIGAIYFDSTLGKPIFYSGTGWVDATGASV